MAPRNNEPFEILDRYNGEAFFTVALALAAGRIVVRNTDKKWNVRLAAKAISAVSVPHSTLMMEAGQLLYLTHSWKPHTARALLAARRKEWKRQRK